MYSTIQTAGGIIAPVKLNDIEFRRRFLAWKEREKVKRKLEQLHDTDTRRAAYYLRNYGAEGLLAMDARARAERKAREDAERERIVDLMTMEAVAYTKKKLNLARRE